MTEERQKPVVNEVGDLVLTEPQAMLALADPFRLQVFDRLRHEGPLRADEPALRAALEVLAAAGLAHADRDLWHAAGKGFVFEIPEDPAGEAAGRRLARTVFLSTVDLARSWAADVEPTLPSHWARASGVLNAHVALSPGELRELQGRLEGILEPYLTREPAEAPQGATPVRILGYFMPEPPETRRP